nr:MAG TPA: hypothetical protein [Caudoviricetes sp.]
MSPQGLSQRTLRYKVRIEVKLRVPFRSPCGGQLFQKGCHAELRRSMMGGPLRSTLRRSSG